METSQFQIKAQEFGPKALLVALFVVSVFSSTSFAAEVKMSPVKSCAGEAEPNFFHLDDSGFEDVEFAFQDSEFGPSLRFGDHQIFFNASGADDQGQRKTGGDWSVISKTPQQFGPGGKNRKPNEVFNPFMDTKNKPNQIGNVIDHDRISLNVGGQQINIQVKSTYKNGPDGERILDKTEMFISGSGKKTMRITPETQKSGKTVTSKMKVESLNPSDNKVVGRTESAVRGQYKESGDTNEKAKFARCENLLKQGKQAKSKYRIPKYTKDLNGDHHIIGAQQGPNNQFKPEDADNQQHASYRQKSNGTPDTPIRKLATR